MASVTTIDGWAGAASSEVLAATGATAGDGGAQAANANAAANSGYRLSLAIAFSWFGFRTRRTLARRRLRLRLNYRGNVGTRPPWRRNPLKPSAPRALRAS